MMNSWCSPSLTSPSGRMLSAMQLGDLAEAGPPNLEDPYLEDAAWEGEAMVLARIVRREEEQEEEEDEGGLQNDDDDDGGDDDVVAHCGSLPFRLAMEPGKNLAPASISTPRGILVPAAATSGSQQKVSSHSGASLPTSGSIEERQKAHAEMGASSFSAFVCGCTLAGRRGSTSCLEQFSREQFRRWHHETYGVRADGASATPTSIEMQAAIHHKMWALKEEVPAKDRGSDGCKYRIREWKLDGHVVCKEAWKLAVGGSSHMQRTIHSLVRRGHGPGDAAAQVQVKRMLKEVETVLDASGVRDNEKRGFAAQWWKNYLLLCDWMPNEQRVVIRGPTYAFLHESVYGPAAREVNLYLCYKVWKQCLDEGLILVAQLLKDAEPRRLKASRSARHSK